MRRVGRSSCWAILFVLGAALDWGGCPAVAQELPAPPEFFDGFDVDRVIEEAGSMRESLHPDWWVSSGGYFISKDGSGMTVHGRLPADDRWRVAYSISNPIDTEDGYLPQKRLPRRGAKQMERLHAAGLLQDRRHEHDRQPEP